MGVKRSKDNQGVIIFDQMDRENLSDKLQGWLKEADGNSAKRPPILYSLYARIAAGLENHEAGSDQIEMGIGEAWVKASEQLGAIELQEAFDIALQLTTLPKSSDPKVEDIQKWMRGDGPVMLSSEKLRKPLLDHLQKEEGGELVSVLTSFLLYDFSAIENSHQAFMDPNCYLALATINLGAKLVDVPDNDNVREFVEEVKTKAEDPKVQKVNEYYLKYEDTKELAEGLKVFFNFLKTSK
jgi:hypothetical protein